MTKITPTQSSLNIENSGAVETLALQWAKKYLHKLEESSSKALESALIDPGKIASETANIYEKTLQFYAQQASLQHSSMGIKLSDRGVCINQHISHQFAKVIALLIGNLRKKYTHSDPRMIGFVSMQFHDTSQMLLQMLSLLKKNIVGVTFKLLMTNLYIPLQQAYKAAADDLDSVALAGVQQILPVSTKIAQKIIVRVIELYPAYSCYCGCLNNPFWICALEGDI